MEYCYFCFRILRATKFVKCVTCGAVRPPKCLPMSALTFPAPECFRNHDLCNRHGAIRLPKSSSNQLAAGQPATTPVLKLLQHKPYQLLGVQNGAGEATRPFVSALLISAFVLNVRKIAYMLGPGGRGARVQMKCDSMVDPKP